MVPEDWRPHPRRSDRRCIGLEDAADHGAIGKHVEIVIVPVAMSAPPWQYGIRQEAPYSRRTQDFELAYVSSGSLASPRRACNARGTSAMPPRPTAISAKRDHRRKRLQ
jgi:hypothetical protein